MSKERRDASPFNSLHHSVPANDPSLCCSFRCACDSEVQVPWVCCSWSLSLRKKSPMNIDRNRRARGDPTELQLCLCNSNGKSAFLCVSFVLFCIICLPVNILALVLYNREPEEEGQTERPPAAANVTFTCHENISYYDPLLASTKFWLEGVLLSAIGLFGLVGNTITLYILPKIQANMTFTKLLMSLAVVDSMLIFFFVIDISLVGVFLSTEPYWYKVLYPFVIHPFRNMMLTASIFMIVAISAERYKALCHPLKYRPGHLRYLLLVIVMTVCLEVPRFFEFQLIEVANSTGNVTEIELMYWTTPLMEQQLYIEFCSYWDDLFATGMLPFAALVYFNSRLFLKIRSSRHHEYRFVGRGPSGSGSPNRHSFVTDGGGPIQVQSITKGPTSPVAASAATAATTAYLGAGGRLNFSPGLEGEVESFFAEESVNGRTTSKYRRTMSQINMEATCTRKVHYIQRQKSSYISTQLQEDDIQLSSPPMRRPLVDDQAKCVNQRHFRKRREKSTALLISIVVVFASCHMYRLLVQSIEISVAKVVAEAHYQYCYQRDRYSVPVVFRFLLIVSHLFIVTNSSLNFLLYCVVGKDFREKCMEMVAWSVAAEPMQLHHKLRQQGRPEAEPEAAGPPGTGAGVADGEWITSRNHSLP